MRTKLTIAVMVIALVFYAVLIGWKGVALLGSGSTVAMLLGIALIVVPLLGVYLVWREIRFGSRSAELAAVLESEGALPVDDLPRRPSGRVDRTAADAVFGQRQAEVEADPASWRAWYRLGVAYDDAGDRTRAREAVRRAIGLFDATVHHS
ncbi:MAG: tetratricopeptide repeat protein [Nocardioidaceae bacterium]